MPLQATSGAASYDAFGGGAAAVPQYIEDVFSTYLYTGNGTTNTIVNGLDLSGKGGLVWIKGRNTAYTHLLFTSGLTSNSYYMQSNGTNGQSNGSPDFNGFNSNGFTLEAPIELSGTALNGNGNSFVSWSLRKQPKFFDIQTWTGTGSNRTISHALGSVPACIMVKRTNSSSTNWAVYHRSLENTQYLVLNSTAAAATGATWWNSTTPTSAVFSLGTDASVNASGGTYIAYIFAHDAGGFGLTGTDNVISCGSFSTNASTTTSVNLGYEPQWLMIKRTDGVGNWYMLDNMRGLAVAGNQPFLLANSSNAEASSGYNAIPTATGFDVPITSNFNESGYQYIYIAIRRGPMKVPTDATKVFSPNIWSGTGTTQQITTGFFPDMFIGINRGAVHARTYATDILRGLGVTLATNLINAENSESGNTFNMTGYSNNNGNLNSTFGGGQTYVGEFFKRAPSFFDEVCYTGTGSAQALTHNLTVVPEMMIVKRRDSATAGSWFVYTSFIGNDGYLALNDTTAADYWINIWNDTTPTSTQFTVGSYLSQSGGTHVAYLFATCAGVSKVGSYTGNGTTQTINCGFTGGARFVLIKRTDAVGDWYTYDTARGMTVLTDPYLLMNSTAAEVATLGSVTTVSTGFALNSTILAAINVNGGSYIFLAIA